MIARFPIGAKVTVTIEGIGYRAEVIDPPIDHPQSEGSVCVRFTPPVADRQDPSGRTFYNVLTAIVGGTQVEEGWSE